MITCPRCKSAEWYMYHKSAIRPEGDSFRCNRCRHKFKRYDGPVVLSIEWGLHQCCDDAANYIYWCREPKKHDLERVGWAISTSADRDGEIIYTHITFCPWCGQKLPENGPDLTKPA